MSEKAFTDSSAGFVDPKFCVIYGYPTHNIGEIQRFLDSCVSGEQSRITVLRQLASSAISLFRIGTGLRGVTEEEAACLKSIVFSKYNHPAGASMLAKPIKLDALVSGKYTVFPDETGTCFKVLITKSREVYVVKHDHEIACIWHCNQDLVVRQGIISLLEE